MVSLPLWATFTIGLGSPVLAFIGVLVAQTFARKSATELESRSKREETMRNLRWAAELAVAPDVHAAGLGVVELSALPKSDLLKVPEKIFVVAALDAVYHDVQQKLDQLGEDAEAVQSSSPRSEAAGGRGGISSEASAEDGGAEL